MSAPKILNFIDTRADSPVSCFTLEVPPSSPFYDLLPDEQTIEIVEPNHELGAVSQ